MQENDPIEKHFRISEFQKRALKKIGLLTIGDLIYHFPSRYGDVSEAKTIATLEKGDIAVIFGAISNLKTSKAFHKRIPMADGTIDDGTGKIKAVWFNQPYIAKMYAENSLVRAEGKISERKGELYLSNPKLEKISKLPSDIGNSLFGNDGESHPLYPVYPESRGVSSNWFYHAIQKIFKMGILDVLQDPIPEEILSKYNLPSLKTALIWIHAPKNQNDALSARKRFSFQEVFFIQIEKQKTRLEYEKHKAFVIEPDNKTLAEFISRFPFKPTSAQSRAIELVIDDFKKSHAMARLLEGDVGSGKTAVAAATVYAVTVTHPKGQNFGNLQTAYMCPTEILAKQHFESFIEYFSYLGISIGLITSSGCKKFPSKINPKGSTEISRNQLLKWIANGEIPILIGTHSLIQKTVKFKNLAYVIIDEQHRFGVNQRMALVRGTARGHDADITPTKKETLDPLLYRDLTYKIRQSIFKVKGELGLGHKEVVYQKALAEEFARSNIKVSREYRVPIKYRNKVVGIYIPDFVIENKVILEIKAIPKITSLEIKQLWNYLKGTDFALALLANFSFTTVDIKRIVYESARSPREVGTKSAFVPHFLSMTATPIPRTLALTIFGDLDLTLLDEMPVGRKPVLTEIVLPTNRTETYEKIRKELAAGRQAYVICPRIDEPDPTKEMALLAKSVKEEAKRLKKEVFPEYEIGILHSKMPNEEKEKIMKEFTDGKIKILAATSVVEVGVNVPNATVIIIEGAERFGLAQLHQLRGRVLRSTTQAYCYVFAEAKTKKTLDRLHALKTAKNGFELAEYDLKFRGSGELRGNIQWGISDVGMEALKNLKMVEAARLESQEIIKTDPELEKYPLIMQDLQTKQEIHFE